MNRSFAQWIDWKKIATAIAFATLTALALASWDFIVLAFRYGPSQVKENAEQLITMDRKLDQVLSVLLTVQGEASVLPPDGHEAFIQVNDFSAASIYGRERELQITNLSNPSRPSITVLVDAHYTSEKENEICRVTQSIARRLAANGNETIKVRLSPPAKP